MTVESARVVASAEADQRDLDGILTPRALEVVAALHRRFEDRRRALLAARDERQARLDAGWRPDAFADGEVAGPWRVAPVPPALADRRVEITGPAEPKMMINALNSGAQAFMCDLEDALAPTFANVLRGQASILAAARGALEFTSPEGREYRVGADPAVLIVRPRGWHLPERHVEVDGEPVSASLLDVALFLLHAGPELLAAGRGPYLYLPKLEGRTEAALWREVLGEAEALAGLPAGSVRVTMLIETILGAIEMEEMLYELRDYAAGLNAGRWDYIFSVIKKFRADPAFVLPDRSSVTMAVPFMHAYTERLVQVCHRHGAHAIGGMAAFIPSRRDPEVNAVAMARVTEDKEREAAAGFDGTWVAHPDLVPVARAAFDAVLGDRPNQADRLREDVAVTPRDLLDVRIPSARVTLGGVRTNISVAVRYLAAWLDGLGAVAIDNLMEDAATAEISRAQLWQWIAHAVPVEGADGPMTVDLYRSVRDAWLDEAGVAPDAPAVRLLDGLILNPRLDAFLTLRAYDELP